MLANEYFVVQIAHDTAENELLKVFQELAVSESGRRTDLEYN